MTNLVEIKPQGYINAAFAGSNSHELFFELGGLDYEIYAFALYDEAGKWIPLVKGANDGINLSDVADNIEQGKEYSICIVGKRNELPAASYLRNEALSVKKICKEEMYDKRTLFGAGVCVEGGIVMMPFYKNNQLLGLTSCSRKSHTYIQQIKNEVTYISATEDDSDIRCIYTKCKRVEGNYLGLIHEDFIDSENLQEKALEYSRCEVTDEFVYLDFDSELVCEDELENYYVAWSCAGQDYCAPVCRKSVQEYISVVQINCDPSKGLELSILVDEDKFGVYQSAEFVAVAEEWEKAHVVALNEKDHTIHKGERTISYEVDTLSTFAQMGTWKLQIYTKKDDVDIVTSATIGDLLLEKELYDGEDTKYKVTFAKKQNVFVINRAFGHNALFKNNLQKTNVDSLEEFLSGEGISPKGNMYGEYISGDDGLKIRFYQNIKNVIEAKLVMYYSQGMGVLYTQDIEVTDGTFEEVAVQTPDIDWDGKFLKPVNSVWFRVAIAIRTNEGIFLTHLMQYDLDTEIERDGLLYDSRKLHLAPIGLADICEIDMVAVPYYAEKKQLSMKFVRPDQIYRSQFTNELLDVKIKKDIMTVKVRCRDCGGTYKGIMMEYRKVKEDDAESYLIPYDTLVEDKGWYIMTTRIDMKKYYMRMLYWDIRCAFEIDGEIQAVSVHSNNQRFLRRYKNVFVDRTYPNDNSILFPYATGNGSVALMHRETCPQDHWNFRLKEKIAQFIYKAFKNYWDKKNIYLVFEKYCTMAQDNGYFFFKYCMDAKVEDSFDGKIFYVLEKGASDWEKIEPYKDHVLKYLSLRHMIYLQACKLMISTDTKGHAYVWRSMGSDIKALSYTKKLVFLQHGVTAFKRGHFERGTNVGCEYFITTSQFEHDIIHNYLEYPEDEIPITGFARWDVLHDKSEGHREILMMPTWRTWLDDAENDLFAESDYCKNYMALLNDPRLDEILKKYDVTLNFYIHPKFRKFITEFSVVSDYIRLIPFGEEPLNELMMQCNLLITDFSSVAWDVYYMNKPVLFYHFDIEVEAKTLGFYMDMENDIFGERAVEPEGLMQLIIEYIENGFVMKEEYSKDREKYFAYIDDDNSKRIWEAIQEREW